MLLLVPTRNRAALAIRTIQSILDAEDSEASHALVSDNSTDTEESRQLATFCRAHSNRVTYIQPQEPLAMTPHWDWLLCYALDHFDSDYLAVVTDRMILKSNAIKVLLSSCRQYPDRVLTYHNHTIYGQGPASLLRVWESGKIELRSTTQLLQDVSRAYFHPQLPRLLNCVVPRRLLVQMRTDAHLLDSISPDFFFCFKCLFLESEIAFLRQAVVVHYALERSNGNSFARGEMTKDHKDFLRTNKLSPSSEQNKGLFWATPEPRLRTLGNAILHEYGVVDQRLGTTFPSISMPHYWRRACVEVARIQNPEVRAAMDALLRERGISHCESLLKRGQHALMKLWIEPDKVYEKCSPYFRTSRFDNLEDALQQAQFEQSVGWSGVC